MQDAFPKIADIPLTLIVKMGKGVCHFLFCLWRQPILWLCIKRSNYFLITRLASPKIVDAPLKLISPRAYLQKAIILFGIVYQ